VRSQSTVSVESHPPYGGGGPYDIFLSHDGRDSGGYARRLREELKWMAPGCRVFSSTDSAYSGPGWLDRLEATLGRCSCLVAVIDSVWQRVVSEAGQSPDNPDDHLRLELEAGIRRGLPLVSAMVGGAGMPAELDLPPALRALRIGDGARISELSWQHDLQRLADAVQRTRAAGPLQVGTVFARHEVESLLGRGAMGVVYRARHLSWDRSDAIKVVSPELASQWAVRERFTRESQLASSLKHDNVVAVYDAGEEQGLLYLTMQLIEGPDLARLLELEGPLAPTHAVQILGPVADALEVAHNRGLVHRDVTPRNIMVEEKAGTWRPYLTDFGLAREEGHSSSGSLLTIAGQAVGAMDYMSPEQIRGEPTDALSDVYALGCILFETLAGQPPYGSPQGMRVLWAHLQDPPPPLSELRPDLPNSYDEVIRVAMAKDPRARPTAGEAVRGRARALRGRRAGRLVPRACRAASAQIRRHRDRPSAPTGGRARARD
jgi:Protein kinase domain